MKETQSLAGIGICHTELPSSVATVRPIRRWSSRVASLWQAPAMDRDSFPSGKIASSPSPPLETPMQDRPTKTTPDLFTPISIGPLTLPNRIVMAPLTRSRAGAGNVPTALNALYYAQRASAGLIIAEATQVVPEGQGYISTPGIHSAEQIKGWQCVTGAVHVCRRPHRAPALACRAHLASILPAGRQTAGRALGHQAERTGLHRQRLRADPHAPRARARRDPRHRRGNTRKGRGTRWRRASTASRCMARTAI